MEEESIIFTIEPYRFALELVVSDDINKSRNARKEIYGEWNEEDGEASGLCATEGMNGALFFLPSTLYHNEISHEIFHITHRIMSVIGAEFDPDNHEPFAYLNGHITSLIYKQLEEWKLTVKHD